MTEYRPKKKRSTADVKQVSGPPACQAMMPIYPVRYSVAPATPGKMYRPDVKPADIGQLVDIGSPSLSGPLADNLRSETGGFPALENAKYVLRGLRPNRTYVYLYCEIKGEKQVSVFCCATRDNKEEREAPEGSPFPARFWRVNVDDEGKHTFVRDSGNGFDFVFLNVAHGMPDTFSILVLDAPLGAEKFEALKAGSGSVLKFATTVTTAPWVEACCKGAAGKIEADEPAATPAVPHTLRMGDYDRMTRSFWRSSSETGLHWSEYFMKEDPPSTADLNRARHIDAPALVVAVFDPVGLMSELNSLAGRSFYQWQLYNEESLRKKWTSKAIDALMAGAREKEYGTLREKMERYRRSLIGDTSVRNISPENWASLEASMGRAQKKFKAEAEENLLTYLAYVREEERQAFPAQYDADILAFQKEMDTHGRNVRAWYQYAGPGAWKPMLELYDLKDNEIYRMCRLAVARCIAGLMLDEGGMKDLAALLAEEGGIFARLIDENETIKAYVDRYASMPVPIGQTVHAALETLGNTLSFVMPDSGSYLLSAVIGRVWAGAGQIAPEALPGRVIVFLRTLSGGIVGRHDIPAAQVPAFLKEMAGQKTNGDFRMRYQGKVGTLPLPPSPLDGTVAMYFEEQALTQKEYAALKRTEIFWYGFKMTLGGVGVYLSLVNTVNAFKKLGSDDGMALVQTLNFTSNANTLAASSAMMAEVHYEHIGNKVIQSSFQRATMWAVAASGIAGAVRDIIRLKEQSGDAAILGSVAVATQLGQFAVALHFLSNIGGRTILGIALPKLTFAQASVVVLVFSIISSYITSRWAEATEKEKITDWLNLCCWGRCLDERWKITLSKAPVRFTAEQEMDGFLQMVYTPRTVTMGGNEGNWHDYIPANSRLLILLPGWKPQISRFQLTVYHGRREEFHNPADVMEINGAWYLTIQTQGMHITAFKGTYWPDGFGDKARSYPIKAS